MIGQAGSARVLVALDFRDLTGSPAGRVCWKDPQPSLADGARAHEPQEHCGWSNLASFAVSVPECRNRLQTLLPTARFHPKLPPASASSLLNGKHKVTQRRGFRHTAQYLRPSAHLSAAFRDLSDPLCTALPRHQPKTPSWLRALSDIMSVDIDPQELGFRSTSSRVRLESTVV